MNKRLWGSTVIVAGMAIGAGMLAIPLATAQLGFINSFWLMLGCWALMAVSALVLLEVTLKFDPQKNSFSQMAGSTLGKPGKILMYLSFLSFIYALISAYVAGGSSMITHLAVYLWEIQIPNEVAGVLFLLILSSFIYYSTAAVDKLNQVLFSAQMIAFILLLTLFMPKIDFSLLLQSEHAALYLAAPIVLTSFGFHTVIPSLVTYMGKDAPQLKWALVCGSLIPLICYLGWELAILGTLPLQGEQSFATLNAENGSIGALVVMLSQSLQSTSLSIFLNIFTNLALMTSFLGVTLSLFDFWQKNLAEKTIQYKKPLAFVLTLVPPFMFTLFIPNGFEKALAYGAIFEVVLCILLPVTMAYVLRRKSVLNNLSSPFTVSGGIHTLGILVAGGLLMVGIDLIIK